MSLFTFLCSLFGCAQSTDYPFESVGVDEFEEIIADTSVVRLDVRRSEEFAEGHIAGAILIDVTQRNRLTGIAERQNHRIVLQRWQP